LIAPEFEDVNPLADSEAVISPITVTDEVDELATAAAPVPATRFPVTETVAPALVTAMPDAAPVELETVPVAFNVPFPETVIP
jgi:hypothetical protein